MNQDATGTDTNVIANALANLYVTYRQRFNMMMPDGAIFMPKHAGKPLPLKNAHLVSHVRRKYAVAIYAGKCASKFLCFDVDTRDETLVRSILRELEALGIPEATMHVSTSGGKGFHIDLFFDGPIYTRDLRILYDDLATRVDLSRVEFRPTHKQSIKLPLSVHSRTGNMCWYLDRHTQRPIDDPAYILDIQPFPVDKMLEVICAIPISAETQKKPPGRSGTPSQLPEGLPDDQIVQAGTRHALLVHQATKARYDGLSEEECENFLTAWTAEQDPSLIESSPEKVAQDIRQLVRWMYGDTFRMRNKPQDEVVFTKQDTALVLGQPTRSLRRLLFLLIGLERSGHPGVSEKDLGLHIGISRCMMEKNLNRLEKEGRIHRIRNPCTRREDGTYYQRSNTYRVQGIPRIQKPDENTPEKHVILSMEMLLSSFDEVYFKTMADMMNKHGLENAALSGELEAYKDTWLYNQGPVTEHDIQRGARRRKL